MERIQVESSSIQSIGYDSDTETLEIEFLTSGLYEYHDVPAYIYEELMSANSHGSYLNSNIKGTFSYSKI